MQNHTKHKTISLAEESIPACSLQYLQPRSDAQQEDKPVEMRFLSHIVKFPTIESCTYVI